MKVLHVINILGLGGAEKLLLQLLPALNKDITTECLILYRATAGDQAKVIEKELRELGITVYTISYQKLVEKQIFTSIKEVVDKGNYDLLHSHLKYADAWIAWLKFRKKITLPVVTTIHGYKDEYENKHGFVISRTLFLSPYYQVSKWIYRQLNGFIMISNIVSSFLNKSGLIGKKKRQQIIYHGYDSSLVNITAKDPGTECTLAIPGRLLKRKGQQYVIEAMQKIAVPGKKVVLHIYGNGPEKETLEALVIEKKLSDRVFLHGYVSDLVDRLRKADVVIIPSLWEGFGLVFLDAFAAGTPVVAFDLPAANEIVADEQNGLLAVPYNSDSLAEKITRICTDPALAGRLSAQAAKDLHGKFSLTRMVKEYREFYTEIAQRSKG